MKNNFSQENVERWLVDTVSDLFTNFLYYDRKNDNIFTLSKTKELIKKNIISKDLMLQVFNNEINKIYNYENKTN